MFKLINFLHKIYKIQEISSPKKAQKRRFNYATTSVVTGIFLNLTVMTTKKKDLKKKQTRSISDNYRTKKTTIKQKRDLKKCNRYVLVSFFTSDLRDAIRCFFAFVTDERSSSSETS